MLVFKFILGGTQIRTGDRGFAIHCLTTWPYRQIQIYFILTLSIIMYLIDRVKQKFNLNFYFQKSLRN